VDCGAIYDYYSFFFGGLSGLADFLPKKELLFLNELL
jgi:hypothetical protein